MNNTIKQRLIIAAIFYALMTVVTFGRAWERGSFVGSSETKGANRFLGTVMASLAWPYYWSTVLWEKP